MSEYVDLQLSHQLTEVEAPAELWQRIEAFPPRHGRTVPRLALATAAAVLALIAVVYSSSRPQAAPRPSAINAGTCNLCHM